MKKRILVIDDDEDLLSCYGDVMEKENTEVFLTSDAEKAQEIMRNESIDLVILDYMMPKIKGDQLAVLLQEINPESYIVFLTGYNAVIDAVMELDLKVSGILIKPVRPSLIEDLVESEDTLEFIQSSHEVIEINEYSNVKWIT